MPAPLHLLLGLLLGAAAAFLAARALFTRGQISAADHAALQTEHAQIKTDEAVLRKLYADAVTDRAAAVDKADTLQHELQEHIASSASLRAERAGLSVNLTEMRVAHTALQAKHDETLAALAGAREEAARLRADCDSKDTLLSEEKKTREAFGTTLQKEFSLLADGVLERKARQFNEQQETKLTDLLSPFKSQIETFQKQVDEKFAAEGKEKSALQREVEMLARASSLLTKQATDLTDALRGSTKQQGDWGEGILESILEHCGLQEGVHFFTQVQSTATDGTVIRPDVVVHLPGSRRLVIDSKVSLAHYWDLCAACDDEARAAHLPLICGSLRAHIDGLYKKPYNEVAGTPDYIVMFVPVEAAYIAAVQHDGALWQDAYKKGVVLISPTNLIPFLRIVQSEWKRDAKYKAAEEIAERAGKMYDKLAGFVASYEKVGTELDAAQKAFKEGMGQLSTGRGNLIHQAEKMRALHIGNKKTLPGELVSDAVLSGEGSALLDGAVPEMKEGLPLPLNG